MTNNINETYIKKIFRINYQIKRYMVFMKIYICSNILIYTL